MKWNALNTLRLKPMPRREPIQTGTRFSNPWCVRSPLGSLINLEVIRGCLKGRLTVRRSCHAIRADYK